MALQPGSRLGIYEIHSAIGAGGMGEVYRARDTRLQRDVALKILPDAFASDAERLARFEREAQVLASLNHPHIAAIHGLEESDGVRALVLELVEGDTLADRITSGALPLDEVVSIARQIADALEAAHEQGIVHRDLKPSNIKVRPDGTVKVLDFGLAKLVGPPEGGPYVPNVGAGFSRPGVTASPTITTPAMTQMGVIMGTAVYMSPEQAKGREADKRSDVWAFGAVLYEMLTGKRAFDGEDMSETLASVLKSDPDWTRLPPDVPQALRTLMQRCLTKDRRQRVSDMAAAIFILNELGNISAPPATGTAEATATRSRWQWLVPAGAAAALTAIIVGAAAWAMRPTSRPPVVAQFSFRLMEGDNFSGSGREPLAISPDGTRMAYTANQRLYLRSIDELEARVIPGTEAGIPGREAEGAAVNPMFSPDGQSIAFFSPGDGTSTVLKRIPLAGGAPAVLANMTEPFGSSWGPDGILIGQGSGGIARVSSNGGMPERIIGVGRNERAHGPQMLPDGKTVLFTLARGARGVDGGWDHAQVIAQSLVDGSRRVVLDGGSDARYLPSGHLIYAVSGTIFAVPFDANRLAVTGAAVPVIVGVRRAIAGQTASAHLAVSDSGTLMYRPGLASISSSTHGLTIGDGHNDPTPLKVPSGAYAHPRVSPDGTLLAVGRSDGVASEIWTYDLSGKTEMRRLTFDGTNRYPVWSNDSRRVTFQSGSDRAIFWQPIDGGAAERLTKPGAGEEHVPDSWSHDGKHLLFSVVKGPTRTLWVLTLAGRKTEPFGKVESSEPLSATFSPDDRWVAYARSPISVAPTPDRGVFVEPFPATGEKYQAPKIFIDYHPVWSSDGTNILFIPASNRNTMAVPIRVRPSVAFGAPVALARVPRPELISTEMRGYDVLRDGRVISLSPGTNDSAGPPATEVRVKLNWFEELKRLVPSN